jgi:hypothetical protein
MSDVGHAVNENAEICRHCIEIKLMLLRSLKEEGDDQADSCEGSTDCWAERAGCAGEGR